MKRLLEHMDTCGDHKCTTPHCISTRSVLGHYVRCKDTQCRLCDPARKEDLEVKMSAPAEREHVAVTVAQLTDDTVSLSIHLQELIREYKEMRERLSKLPKDCDEFLRLTASVFIKNAAIADTNFYIHALTEMTHVAWKNRPLDTAWLHRRMEAMGEKRQKTSDAVAPTPLT